MKFIEKLKQKWQWFKEGKCTKHGTVKTEHGYDAKIYCNDCYDEMSKKFNTKG